MMCFRVIPIYILKQVSINHLKFPVGRIPILDILSTGNLRDCLLPSVRRTLDELPESLEEAYERILRKSRSPTEIILLVYFHASSWDSWLSGHSHMILAQACTSVFLQPEDRVEEKGVGELTALTPGRICLMSPDHYLTTEQM